MPKKISNADAWPTLVLEHLSVWGKCIYTQRLLQRITAADLCARLGISRATLRRIEQGDPGAGAGAYLTALLMLGLADQTTPPVPPMLWQHSKEGKRVKPRNHEKESGDDEYF